MIEESFKFFSRPWNLLAFGVSFACSIAQSAGLPDETNVLLPEVAEASGEGLKAIASFEVAEGYQADLFAAEPHLANPVAFAVDPQGRFYVAETFRHGDGVLDIRGRINWVPSDVLSGLSPEERGALSEELLDVDLASRSVDARIAYLKKYRGPDVEIMKRDSERIRLIVDENRDGAADFSTVYADGFNEIAGGIGAGLLAREGKVWFTNIPNLWQLEDRDGDGIADVRKSLHYGYGVRTGFLGHDLHGLCLGPYGKIYFSIGDRGTRVNTFDGRLVSVPDTGAVFRCNPDGTELEVFAVGLRNPQELAFDQYGDLFTGDNNSDGGDRARWVYLAEGGDSGWRIGFQFLNEPESRGVWNSEKMWHPRWDGQAAFLNPPIANVANGPSGLTYYPGTGLSDEYNNAFFLVDFRGSARSSGIYAIRPKHKGAGFEIGEPEQFIWGVLATDADFAYDGGLYFSDWVEGWGKTAKGRIYRVHNPDVDQREEVLQTKRLMAEGMRDRTLSELKELLGFPDRRVRMEAQFAMVSRGLASGVEFEEVATGADHEQLGRIHAIWGLTQLAGNLPSALEEATEILIRLTENADSEIRNQSARSLGMLRAASAYDALVGLLSDSNARVRYSACMSLGKLGRSEAVPSILSMIRDNDDEDAYLRHAGVMALARIRDFRAIEQAAQSGHRAVRLASLLAMRKLERPEIAQFLKDEDPFLVREAAIAINDVPIDAATQELAAMLTSDLEGVSVLRRAINANFRLGKEETADRLAAFTAGADANPELRGEALRALSSWPSPSGRDMITGVWRPLIPAARDAKIPAEALQRHSEIFASDDEEIQRELTGAIVRLGMTEMDGYLAELAVDEDNDDRSRVEALRGLETLQSDRLEETLRQASQSDSDRLRVAIVDISTRVHPESAVALLSGVLAEGNEEVKKGALTALKTIQTPEAAGLAEEWLDKMTDGEVEEALHLEVLEAAEAQKSDSIREKLRDYRSQFPQDSVDAYAALQKGGDWRSGRTIFEEKLEASCIRCHSRRGEGGLAGPPLDNVGQEKDRRYILESIIFPNATITEGYTNHEIETKSGIFYSGVIVEENEERLTLNSPEDGIVKIQKSDIEFRTQGLSGMPEGMLQLLTKHEIRDLVEFLAGRPSFFRGRRR